MGLFESAVSFAVGGASGLVSSLASDAVDSLSGGSSQEGDRQMSPEEKRLWDAQAKNQELLNKIAEEQYNISEEERKRFDKVFREGSDTEAKRAIADLKEKITGEKVSTESITAVNIDSLLRDTLLAATPEFRVAADTVIKNSDMLTDTYGTKATGLSDAFSKNIKTYAANYGTEVENATGDYQGAINNLSRKYDIELTSTTQAYGQTRENIVNTFGVQSGDVFSKYSENLQKTAEEYGGRLQTSSDYFKTRTDEATGKYLTEVGSRQLELDKKLASLQAESGTIREDILSRETGAAYGGISSGFAEAKKQLDEVLSRRGVDTRSGVGQSAMVDLYQQEALAKAGAGTQARGRAFSQSEALRAQEAQIAMNQYQTGVSSAQQALASQQAATQGIYAAQGQTAGQQYQAQQAAIQGQYQGGLYGVESLYQADIAAQQAAYEGRLQATQQRYQTGYDTTQAAYGAGQQATQGILAAQSGALAQGYQAQSGTMGNVYNVGMANLAQGYQTQQAATLQGIGSLTQVAQAGQGYYTGAQNYLAQASGSAGTGAQVAASAATGIGGLDMQKYMSDMELKGVKYGAVAGVLSTAAGAGIKGAL